jgi:hypothetical protein
MSVVSSSNDVQQLLAEAKSALITEQSLSALQRALDICLKDSHLVSQIVPHFFEFVKNSDPLIRKWVASAVETVCKQYPQTQMLSTGLTILHTLTGDENVHVVKRALIASTKLVPVALQLKLEDKSDEEGRLREVITELKQQNIALLNSPVSDVCLYAIRFVQNIVRWCMEHGYADEGNRLLEMLCSALTSPTSFTPSALIVLVHTLSNLALLCTSAATTTFTPTSTSPTSSSSSLAPSSPLVCRIVDTLVTLYTATVTSPHTFRYTSQLRSVQHALKLAFLRLIKAQLPSLQVERIQDALVSLGVHAGADPLPPALDLFEAESVENQNRDNSKRKFAELGEDTVVSPEHENTKRLKMAPTASTVLPPSTTATTSAISTASATFPELSPAAILAQTLFSLLPHDHLVALVYDTLSAPLPPPPPSTHSPLTLTQFITALQTGVLPPHASLPLTSVVASLSRPIDPRKDPRLVSQPLTVTSSSTSAPAPASATSMPTVATPTPTPSSTSTPTSMLLPPPTSTTITPTSPSPTTVASLISPTPSNLPLSLTPELIAQLTQRLQLIVPNLTPQTLIQFLSQQLAPSVPAASSSPALTSQITTAPTVSSEPVVERTAMAHTGEVVATAMVAIENNTGTDSGVDGEQLNVSLKKATAPTKPMESKVSMELHEVLPLNSETMRELGNVCFARVLDMHHGTGVRHMREALLAALASAQPLDSPAVTHLLTHIVTHFPAPHSVHLALTWLLREFLSAPSRYSVIVCDIFLRIQSKVSVKDKAALSTLLLHLPTITPDVFAFLESLCRLSEKFKLGLNLLRDITLYRVSEARSTALNMLLDYTMHQDKVLRTQAIRLVSNKLFPLKLFTTYIEQTAVARLESLRSLPPSAASVATSSGSSTVITTAVATTTTSSSFSASAATTNIATTTPSNNTETHAAIKQQSPEVTTEEEEETEQIKRMMLLYLALCAKKPSLLRGLVEIYAATGNRPNVRKVMHTQIVELVRVIGMHSPHLLQLFADCPRGAESLLLVILHALTEGTTPSPALVQTIKRAYSENRFDARFLIPILPGLTKVKRNHFYRVSLFLFAFSLHWYSLSLSRFATLSIRGYSTERNY